MARSESHMKFSGACLRQFLLIWLYLLPGGGGGGGGVGGAHKGSLARGVLLSLSKPDPV